MKTISILTRERYVKLFAVIGILLLCVLIILKVENILLSFVFASVTYYLLAPLVNTIERAGISRKLGVAGLFLCIVFVLLLGVYILLPAITAPWASECITAPGPRLSFSEIPTGACLL